MLKLASMEKPTISPLLLMVLQHGGPVAMAPGNPPMSCIPISLVHIDPQFAAAYAWLGRMYSDSEQRGPAQDATTKAWQLRDRASDRERFFITFSYQRLVLRNVEKARQTLQVWARTYPRDISAHSFLGGNTSTSLGKFEEAGEESQKAIELDPDASYPYMNLAASYRFRNRLPEAEMTLQRAANRKLELPEILANRFLIAFLKNDQNEM
jgi:eukaryotic-like serine/threonine-protein kinase